MYDEHVPVIAAAMRNDPAIFARAIMFAILSARVQFPRVPDQCLELTKLGIDARCLWGWKYDSYVYVQEHKYTLAVAVIACEGDTEKALAELCVVPGLGLVKGAFVLQMLGHDVACLDARNIKRENLPLRRWRSDGDRKSTKAFRKKIAAYVQETGGRSRELWDAWCNDVGEGYGISPEKISRMHVDAIVPKGLRDPPKPWPQYPLWSGSPDSIPF